MIQFINGFDTEAIRANKVIDTHNHLRVLGPEMRTVLTHAGPFCQVTQMMPNTEPAILSGEDAARYEREARHEACGLGFPNLRFIPSIKITPATTPDDIHAAHALGIRNAKTYFKDTTTNSPDGIVPDLFHEKYPVYEAMQRCGWVSTVHFEVKEYRGVLSPFMDRERRAIVLLERLHDRFPKLKILVAHVSTKEMVETVFGMPDTVRMEASPNHLFYTAHNFWDTKVKPWMACHPKLQEPSDRDALQQALLSGSKKVMYGSDNALHTDARKHGVESACGIFSAPTGLLMVIGFLYRHARLNAYDVYTRLSAAEYFGIELPPEEEQETFVCVRKPWLVPSQYPIIGTTSIVVPLAAGETLDWQFAPSE